MEVIGTLEFMFFNRNKCKVQKKFRQTMLTLMTLLLWISPGLGDDKPPDCKAQDPEFCSSPCTYLKERCNGNSECTLDLCSYLYPQLFLRDLEMCWDLSSVCSDEFRYPSKRGILNKNIAYLLLKLHPFLNQTSQFGFLSSGRFRRISGNFGTEFLGKRANIKPVGRRPSKGNTQSSPNPKPTPKFYSLPLDKFAKSKVLKKNGDVQQGYADAREKRLSIRGNEKVILGSEFLGKRGGFYNNEKIRRLSGTEFLGKRNEDPFDASEFLGKRMASSSGDEDMSGKRQNEPVSGSELLGKKSSQESSSEFKIKRFGGQFLGMRFTDKELPVLQSKRAFSVIRKDAESGFRPGDPGVTQDVFSNYDLIPSSKIPVDSNIYAGNDSGIWAKLKIK